MVSVSRNSWRIRGGRLFVGGLHCVLPGRFLVEQKGDCSELQHEAAELANTQNHKSPIQKENRAMANSTNGERQQFGSTTLEPDLENLIQRVHYTFMDVLDLSLVGDLEGEELRREIRLLVEQVCDKVCHEEKALLNQCEHEMIVEAVLDETFGFGPLEILLKDPENGDTLIKGPREVYVLREEREHRTNVTFRDMEHLTQIIERIASSEGNQVNVPFPLQLSEEDCIVIRHSSENLPTLEVFMRRWSP